jgi:hypothetical protein
LNRQFIEQTERIAQSLNKIHANRIVVKRFANLAELAETLQELISACEPYTRQA